LSRQRRSRYLYRAFYLRSIIRRTWHHRARFLHLCRVTCRRATHPHR
jgi:hypothetical protein